MVPADLVANSILLATAEALADPGQHRIYQACTGSNNPILLGNLINLFQTESQRNWEKYDRLFYSQPKHEFRVVSRGLFLLVMSTLCAAANVWGAIRRVLGLKGESAAMDALRTTETLARTFSFYTTPKYRFHSTKLQGLAQRFDLADTACFPVDARLIDWPDYLCRVHMAGLNQYALTRRRVRAAAVSPEAIPADAVSQSPAV